MKTFTTYLTKILGREPDQGEMHFYNCFNPENYNIQKRFDRYSASRALFLNIDDDHYLYVSNHTSKLRCSLDMATRQLNTSECYKHGQGNIMLGITKPENEKHINARISNYNIYLHSTSQHEANDALKRVSQFSDHISLIKDETPWERICNMCAEIQTGIHLTCSAQRLLKHYKNGLIYLVEENRDKNFKNAIKYLDTIPAFIGKTRSFPIISLDNELTTLELPIANLKQLFLLQNTASPAKSVLDQNTEDPNSIDLDKEPEDLLEQLANFLKKEKKESPSKKLCFDSLPDLFIENFPLKSLSFTPNGISLHILSAIVSLHYRGYKPLALSYYAETKADFPQEIDTSLSAIAKAAKLFGIPMANNCIIHGKENHLKLFFICKKQDDIIPDTFQEENNFICLLGDPNGEIRGSAYAHILGHKTPFTPPGIMTGTLAALVDVLDECKNKNILVSANFIGRGGLITALKTACSHSKGAKIYSERKGPEQIFIYGEHQAAALISIKEKHLIDLAKITSNYNLSSSTIGRVTENNDIIINNKSLS
ncbi:MAG: AIR synthase-related protein [Candidatus Neomarinimicrobiota bacterium]